MKVQIGKVYETSDGRKYLILGSEISPTQGIMYLVKQVTMGNTYLIPKTHLQKQYTEVTGVQVEVRF